MFHRPAPAAVLEQLVLVQCESRNARGIRELVLPRSSGSAIASSLDAASHGKGLEKAPCCTYARRVGRSSLSRWAEWLLQLTMREAEQPVAASAESLALYCPPGFDKRFGLA